MQSKNKGRLDGNNRVKENVEIIAPLKKLKHLRNFWITLGMLLIDCEVKLIFTLFENCVVTLKQQEMLILMMIMQ